MSVVDIKKIYDDKLKAKLKELVDVNNYLDGCKNCGLPRVFHKGTGKRSSQA